MEKSKPPRKIRKKKNNYSERHYCCVPQCSELKNPNNHMHQAPNDLVLGKKWAYAIKVDKPLNKTMKVCSKHFKEEDYLPSSVDRKFKRLKLGTVPSLNLPVRLHDELLSSPVKGTNEDRETSKFCRTDEDIQCSQPSISIVHSHYIDENFVNVGCMKSEDEDVSVVGTCQDSTVQIPEIKEEFEKLDNNKIIKSDPLCDSSYDSGIGSKIHIKVKPFAKINELLYSETCNVERCTVLDIDQTSISNAMAHSLKPKKRIVSSTERTRRYREREKQARQDRLEKRNAKNPNMKTLNDTTIPMLLEKKNIENPSMPKKRIVSSTERVRIYREKQKQAQQNRQQKKNMVTFSDNAVDDDEDTFHTVLATLKNEETEKTRHSPLLETAEIKENNLSSSLPRLERTEEVKEIETSCIFSSFDITTEKVQEEPLWKMTEIFCKTEPKLVSCDEPQEDIIDTNKGNYSIKNNDANDEDTFHTVLIPEIKDEFENPDYDELLRMDPLCDSLPEIKDEPEKLDYEEILKKDPECDSDINFEKTIQMQIESDTKEELKQQPPCDIHEELLDHEPINKDQDLIYDECLHPVQKDHNHTSEFSKEYEIIYTENPIQHKVCTKEFDQNDNLNIDMRTTDAEEISFPCKCCAKKFTDFLHLNAHMKTHTEENPFSCTFCVKKFVSLIFLNDHMRTHIGEKPFLCKFCAKMFSDQSNLNSHIKTHAGENPFPCTLCAKKFSEQIKLDIHIKNHSRERLFSCKFCAKKYFRQHHLNDHIKYHTGENLFPCEICSKKFPNKSKLNAHMKTHTGEKEYSCQFCTKMYSLRHHLNSHMRIHTGEKPFSCKFCAKKFSQSMTLSDHMRTHTGEKPFSCKFCVKKFANQSNLSIHMRTHTGEKPFSCKFCAKKFSQSRTLSDHMRTHTGEKPFSCKFCVKKFANQTNLSSHVRTHTGEKPFSCKFCAKKFSQSTTLSDHMRTHTGEKPFSCKFCAKKFSQQSNLNSHMKTHTAEN